MKIVEKEGWNWETIGKYHSYKKNRYKKYAENIYKIIYKEQLKGKN